MRTNLQFNKKVVWNFLLKYEASFAGTRNFFHWNEIKKQVVVARTQKGEEKSASFLLKVASVAFFFREMNSQKDCEISAEASTKSAWDAWSVLFFDPTPLYKRAIIIVMSTSHVHYVQTRRIWTYEMHLCKMHLYKIEAKKRILMNEDCITDLTKILGYKFHWEEFTEICYRLFSKNYVKSTHLVFFFPV